MEKIKFDKNIEYELETPIKENNQNLFDLLKYEMDEIMKVEGN